METRDSDDEISRGSIATPDIENPMVTAKRVSQAKTMETFEVEMAEAPAGKEPGQGVEIINNNEDEEEKIPDTTLGKFFYYADKQFKHIPNVETAVADLEDMPVAGKWISWFLYTCGLLICFVVLFNQNYIASRTDTFITLDNTSGVCGDDLSSKTCCEVPQTVSGQYFVDTRRRWNTQSGFNFARSLYTVDLTGVSYTNDEWSSLMQAIKVELYNIGAVRGRYRDFSWNLIAWASFTAINTYSGYLQFYPSGDVGVIFNKQILTAGYASNYSDIATCDQVVTASYQPASRLLQVNTNLQSSKEDNCESKSGGVIACSNPCPRILAPMGFGYDSFTSVSTTFSYTIDMAAVTTAVAVNMGIKSLDRLVQFPGDNNRISLLKAMLKAGYITEYEKNNTNSYFDNLYSPMNPIYCIDYANSTNSSVASCMVRVGNTLLYPYVNSFGWSATGYEYPTICKNTTIKSPKTPSAKYYCNQFDLVVGFIYYPVPDINITEAIKNSNVTSKPSKAPTFRPTRLPTIAPSGPSRTPTRRPSQDPSFAPSENPTVTPTASKTPTQQPTLVPTTATPTRRPSRAPTGAAAAVEDGPDRGLGSNKVESVHREEESVAGWELATGPASSPAEAPAGSPAAAPNAAPAGSPADVPNAAPATAPDAVSPAFPPAPSPTVPTPSATSPALSPADVPTFAAPSPGGSSSYGSYSYSYSYSYFSYYYSPYSYSSNDDFYFSSTDDDFAGSSTFLPGGTSTIPLPSSSSSSVASEEQDSAGGATGYGYYANDDYEPAVPSVIDNGKIFNLLRVAANERNSSLYGDGDIYVPTKGYQAMISSLLGYSSKTFTEDFNAICGSNANSKFVPSGCAAFAIEFYGGDDRIVSIYDYQPANAPAFTNTLYNSKVMAYAVKTPPTILIQSYYSCVLRIYDALVQASGLSVANTQLYVSIAMIIYVFMIVNFYNKIANEKVMFKSEKLKAAELEQQEKDDFLAAILEDVRAGRVVGAEAATKALATAAARRDKEMEKAKQDGSSVKGMLGPIVGVGAGG